MRADVTLITSLYRTIDFLPHYLERTSRLLTDTAKAGLNVELIVVANDITDEENTLLTPFIESHDTAAKLITVPRESLYASWNRGVKQATGQFIGFWNVDDVRFTDALIAIAQPDYANCDLIYFPFYEEEHLNYWGIPVILSQLTPALPYDAERFQQKMRIGPFFMFTKALFEDVGDFDERFRIAGDFDWCIRAIKQTSFCTCPVPAGKFINHGKNLSAGVHPLQIVEDNIIFLKHNLTNRIVPAEPQLMRQALDQWSDITISDEQKTFLVGSGSQKRWQTYQTQLQAERQQRRRTELLRRIPRKVIETTGLRPFLYKLGLVKSPPDPEL